MFHVNRCSTHQVVKFFYLFPYFVASKCFSSNMLASFPFSANRFLALVRQVGRPVGFTLRLESNI